MNTRPALIPAHVALFFLALCDLAAQTPTWTKKHGPLTARDGHVMAYDAARGQVVLFGGWTWGTVHRDTWVWDGSNWTEKFPITSPPARYNHAVAYDAARGQVVLFGGSSGTEPLRDTWVWDGTNWTQKSPATSPPARASHAMAYDIARGQVVLFGGHGGAAGYLGDTWVWDGSNWSQKNPPTSPPAPYSHALAYDAARAQVVLFGSRSNLRIAQDTWVWDGSNWTQKATTGPTAWSRHAMAYDAARRQVVLFALSDTWVWDGGNWTRKVPSASPPGPRDAHAMAYDAGRAQVVLFGGDGIAVLFSDTWVWDGSNWSQKTPVSRPLARWAHAMAYHAARGRVVLFGGQGSATTLADTWVWDGTDWIQKSPATSPPRRSDHAMAHDAACAQVVLFGGGGSPTGYFGDTWTWDGSNWTQMSPAASPSARMNHAMAYDAARAEVVLFSGWNAPSDTWVWNGGQPAGPGGAPVVLQGGVVNAASFAPGKPLGPGSIAALFGNRLAPGTAIAGAPPLPTLLGGSRVTLNSVAVPLFFVSSAQINFQVPWELQGQTQASVSVSVDSAASPVQTISLASFSPGIFMLNPSGQGAIVIASTGEVAAPAGSIPGLAARPVKRGEYLSIYCTGLGPVTNRPASGAASPSNPVSTTTTTPSVTIGGMPAAVSFSGLAPGFVGLYQVNVQVPPEAPTGGGVPVVLAIGGVASNTATVAVQ